MRAVRVLKRVEAIARNRETRPEHRRANRHHHTEACFVTGEWWESALVCGKEVSQ